ncbi:hypothetical protein DRQ36_03715, partial [bacterium]
MKLASAIGIAVHGINQNKLRGFLSILGVIVGVVAVIGMGALAASMQEALSKQAQQLGANTFTIERVSPVEMGMLWMGGNRQAMFELFRRPRFDLSYVDELRDNCPSAQSIAPMSKGTNRFRHRRKRSDESITVLATNEDFLQGGVYELGEGRFLMPNDVTSRRYVCVVGQEVVNEFFEGRNPIGEEIAIGPMSCKIVGTLKEVGAALGENPDNVAIVPITTALKHWPWMRWQMSINIEAEPGKFEDAQDEAITTLRRLRELRPWEKNNFSIITSEMMMELFGKITGAASVVVLLIAGVSLVVAGIGIMNVMFVSVRERTRETGIRKACGASSNSIMMQFAIEAVML